MKERLILFSGPMVRALRDGSKTQTRRIAKTEITMGRDSILAPHRGQKHAPVYLLPEHAADAVVCCPYGLPCARFTVRETFYAWGHWTKRYSEKKHREEWHFVDETMGTGKAYRYEADEKLPRRKRELHEVGWWKRPAIFMPRAASRITLEITSVRVERLQDISEADAMAEGIVQQPDGGYGLADTTHYHSTDPRQSYFSLWEAINGDGSVEANPWVWAIEFRRLP